MRRVSESLAVSVLLVSLLLCLVCWYEFGCLVGSGACLYSVPSFLPAFRQPSDDIRADTLDLLRSAASG